MAVETQERLGNLRRSRPKLTKWPVLRSGLSNRINILDSAAQALCLFVIPGSCDFVDGPFRLNQQMDNTIDADALLS